MSKIYSLIEDQIPEGSTLVHTSTCPVCQSPILYLRNKGLTSQQVVDRISELEASEPCLQDGGSPDACGICYCTLERDELEAIAKTMPKYAVAYNEVFQIKPRPKCRIEVKGTVPSSHLGKGSIRFFRGFCNNCSDDFIYSESNDGTLIISPILIGFLEQTMIATYGDPEINDGEEPTWRCVRCDEKMTPKDKYTNFKGWGTLVPEFALLEDGEIYSVSVKEGGTKSNVSVPKATFSHSARSNYHYETEEDRWDDIQDLIAKNKDKRPKASSAWKNLPERKPEQQSATFFKKGEFLDSSPRLKVGDS